MERWLRREEVMTIEVLADRGLPMRAIARQLGIAESPVRYRLARRARDTILVRVLALTTAGAYHIVVAERSHGECPVSAGNHVTPCQLVRPLWQ